MAADDDLSTLSDEEKKKAQDWYKVARSGPDFIIENPDLFFADERIPKLREYIYKEAYESGAKLTPAAVLNHSDGLKGKDYREEVLKEANATLMAKPEEILLLDHDHLARFFKEHPEMKEKAFRAGAAKRPTNVLTDSEFMAGAPYEKEVLKIAATANAKDESSFVTIARSDYLKSKLGKDADPILEQAFRKAAVSDSGYVLENYKKFKGTAYEDEVLKTAFLTAAKEDPAVALANSQLVTGKSYEKEVRTALQNITENRETALKVMSHINSYHESKDEVRFGSLKAIDAAGEFNLITMGREEAYTSTYNGVLKDMLGKLKHDKKMLTDVLTPGQQGQMATFMEAAATFNKMDEVLKFIPADKLPDIVKDMTDRMAKSQDLKEAMTMSSLMTSLKGNDKMRHMLEASIKDHYDGAKTQGEKDKFGLLASSYAKNAAKNISSDMKSFFLGVAANPRYALPDMSHMTEAQLADKPTSDKSRANYQLMVFSEDKDSKDSFENWKNTYQGKSGWKIEDKGSFVEIHSTSGKVPVHIFANKPGMVDQAIPEIEKEAARQQGNSKATFQEGIIRGHSYHLDDFLKYVSPDMSLVILGSCGGYQNISKVLQQSPDAQVIATQGTGDMHVNDPLMFDINQSINKDGGITWQKEQKALDSTSARFSAEYLLPDRNVPLSMLRRYNELQKQSGSQPEKHTRLEIPPAVDIQSVPGRPPIEKSQSSSARSV